MGADVNYGAINYRDQREFDYFFATAFDRYDRNRDGRIDFNEFQPLINDMCAMIGQKYGYGPTLDKIRQAWYAMDFNRSGYITRNEFSTRAKYEIERILTQPDYVPPAAPYGPHVVPPYPPHYGPPPAYGPPHYGPPPAYGPHVVPPSGYYPPPPHYGAPGYGAPGYGGYAAPPHY